MDACNHLFTHEYGRKCQERIKGECPREMLCKGKMLGYRQVHAVEVMMFRIVNHGQTPSQWSKHNISYNSLLLIFISTGSNSILQNSKKRCSKMAKISESVIGRNSVH